MDVLHSLFASLLSPMVLAFALGVFATLVRSDLKFPEELYVGLTIYLLFAIGLKGGAKLEGITFASFWRPACAGLLLCVLIPLWCYAILRAIGRFDAVNSAAIAAHFGSVSAVTFGESLAFLELLKVPHEPFMPALLAIMEIPAIVIAIFMGTMALRKSGIVGGSFGSVLHELLTGKSILLIVGGLLIGLVSGAKGAEQVGPFFDAPFRGVLTLFLLEVGLVTGRRLADLRKAGPFLVVFSTVMPLLHGLLGAWLGKWAGLSVGGTTILATLAASASYIAAPAAIRVALPQANPAYYLTSALAVAFPFNMVFGIPIYYTIAKRICS
jgi:uncharacterized protein